MKILTNLTAVPVESAWSVAGKAPATPEDEGKQTAAIRGISPNSLDGWMPKGTLIHIADEARSTTGEPSGFFRNILVSSSGILIHRGDAAVGIPLQEIIKLAESIEPGLKPD